VDDLPGPFPPPSPLGLALACVECGWGGSCVSFFCRCNSGFAVVVCVDGWARAIKTKPPASGLFVATGVNRCTLQPLRCCYGLRNSHLFRLSVSTTRSAAHPPPVKERASPVRPLLGAVYPAQGRHRQQPQWSCHRKALSSSEHIFKSANVTPVSPPIEMRCQGGMAVHWVWAERFNPELSSIGGHNGIQGVAIVRRNPPHSVTISPPSWTRAHTSHFHRISVQLSTHICPVAADCVLPIPDNDPESGGLSRGGGHRNPNRPPPPLGHSPYAPGSKAVRGCGRGGWGLCHRPSGGCCGTRSGSPTRRSRCTATWGSPPSSSSSAGASSSSSAPGPSGGQEHWTPPLPVGMCLRAPACAGASTRDFCG